MFESGFVCPYALTELIQCDSNITTGLLLERYLGGAFREIQHPRHANASEIIDPWYEFKYDYTDWSLGDHDEGASTVYLLKHYHPKSNLLAAVGRIDKREWLCYTCGDRVPLPVLFRAAFRGME